MRKSIRLTVFACAVAPALAVTALAAASFTPSMGIFQANYKPGGAGAVTIVVAQEAADDATARIVIYAAPGYALTLGQAPGATIGDVVAHVQLLQTGSTNPFTLTGAVKVENAANFTTLAAQCAGAAPEAVWSLNASVAGQATVIPIFVNRTSGVEAAFSSAKLTVCFRNPALPAPQGSGGTKFLDAAFSVRGVFRNPGNAGTAVWRSVFTPWAGSSPVPNAAGTREAQAFVPMPYTLTLRRTKAPRRFFRVAGVLNIAGRRPSGASVALYTGVRGKNGIQYKRAATTRTRRGGTYAFNRRLPRKRTFVFVQRLPASVSCATSASGAPCTAAIESNAVSRVLSIAPAKRRRR